MLHAIKPLPKHECSGSQPALHSVEAERHPEILGAWSCDLATENLAWTDGVFDLFGLDRSSQIDRRSTLEMYCPEWREILELRRSRAIRDRTAFSLDVSIRRFDGQQRWMRITAAPKIENGHVTALFGMKQDVTREKQEWETLRMLAFRDPLTGLSNRASFQSEFLDAGTRKLSGVGAVVLFDLDRFKTVNDRWGHLAGDTCLATFARRLFASFPDADMIARIGGDEFALLLPRNMGHKATWDRLRNALPRLSEPFSWRDHLLPMGVSAGIAFAEAGRDLTAEQLFAAADARLYRSKAARTYRRRCFYGPR